MSLGAIAATRRAAPAQVCVSHMSQMITAVWDAFQETTDASGPRRARGVGQAPPAGQPFYIRDSYSLPDFVSATQV